MDVFVLEEVQGAGLPARLSARPASALVQGRAGDYVAWVGDNLARAGVGVRPLNAPAPALVAGTVSSLQRYPLPEGKDVGWVAREYFRWLPWFCLFLVRTRVEGPSHTIFFLLRRWTLLELRLRPGTDPDRRVFAVAGGRLARKDSRARLEFRRLRGRPEVMVLLHAFRPSLPWWLYRLTQALFHLVVMHAFGRHLRRL